MTFRTRRLAAWLALLSVALYALWPLLATAQPRTGEKSYQLCPHASLHQLAEQNGEQQPSSNRIWDNGQLQCVFALGIGDGASAAPSAGFVLVLDSRDVGTATASPLSVPWLSARFYVPAPRGPPVLS